MRFRKTGLLTTGLLLLLAAAAFLAFHFFHPVTETEEPSGKEGDSAFQEAMQKVRDDRLSAAGKVYEADAASDLSALIAELQAGDTLLFKSGVYPETIDLSGLHGTEGNYITLAASDGAVPVLDGSGLSVPSDDPSLPDGPVMIRISDCSYVRLSGFTIVHASGQSACGVSVEAGCNHLIIDHCNFSDIRVPDPSVEDHCANGILLFGDSAEKDISDVFIYQNTLRDCETGWAECISVAGHTANVTVEANTIDHTGNIGIDFTGNYGYCPDPSKDFPVNCQAVGNTVKNCRSVYATSYGLYADGAQGIEFRDNIITSCSGGIEIGAEQPQKSEEYATRQILVTGNTVSDCPEAGITIGGYETGLGLVKDVEVSGNTCSNNGTDPDGAILTLSKCQEIRIENNIFDMDSAQTVFVRSEMGKEWTKDITFRGNTYRATVPAEETYFQLAGEEYSGFRAWQKAVGEKKAAYQEMNENMYGRTKEEK